MALSTLILSNSQGISGMGGETSTQLWHYLLRAGLAADYPTKTFDTPMNASVSGKDTKYFVDNYASIIAANPNPDFVFIDLLTNDASWWGQSNPAWVESPTDTTRNLTWLVGQLRAISFTHTDNPTGHPVVILMQPEVAAPGDAGTGMAPDYLGSYSPPPPIDPSRPTHYYGYGRVRANLVTCNDILDTLTATLGVPIVKTWENSVALWGDLTTNTSYAALYDGVHYNATGHAAMAGWALTLVESLLTTAGTVAQRLALFDPAIFDPAIFDTGTEPPQTVFTAPEGLRVYKHNQYPSGTYADITSSDAGGFSELTRTDVYNDAGSLEFTLHATAPAMFNAWIDEGSFVDYYVNGWKVGPTYVVDEYMVDWTGLSCNVKCVGILALGSDPGTHYLALPQTFPWSPGGPLSVAPLAQSPIQLIRSVALGWTPPWYPPSPWKWRDANAGIGTKYLQDDFAFSDHALTGGAYFRGEGPPPSAPWSVQFETGSPDVRVQYGSLTFLSAANGDSVACIYGTSLGADHYVQAVVSSVMDTDTEVGLIARYQSGKAYRCSFSSTQQKLWKYTGGAWHAIGGTASISVSQGDVIGFSVVGTTLSAYINGVYIGGNTDGTITGTGKPGVYFGADSTRVYGLGVSNFFAQAGGITPYMPVNGYTGNSGPASADIIKTAAETGGLTFWFDSTNTLNVEARRTVVDRTYSTEDDLYEFNTTYTSRGIINSLTVLDSNGHVGDYADSASVADYGTRHADVTLAGTYSSLAAQAYANAYFAQYAKPRLSAEILVDHDPTLRSGLLVAITGMADGRTYQDLIQQVAYTLGDVYDRVQLGVPPLALTGTGL